MRETVGAGHVPEHGMYKVCEIAALVVGLTEGDGVEHEERGC